MSATRFLTLDATRRDGSLAVVIAVCAAAPFRETFVRYGVKRGRWLKKTRPISRRREDNLERKRKREIHQNGRAFLRVEVRKMAPDFSPVFDGASRVTSRKYDLKQRGKTDENGDF